MKILTAAILSLSLAALTYAQEISISEVVPSIGLTGSSTRILGAGFSGASHVLFNGHPAVFQVDSAEEITAIVPLAATPGPIVVTTASGQATSGTSFQVVAKQWNAVKDFSPVSNPAGVWSYGWAATLNGAFTLANINSGCSTDIVCWSNNLAFPDTAAVQKNDTQQTVVHETVIVATNILWLGAQSNSVVTRFTAPISGNYNITGSFQLIDYNITVPVATAVTQNGATTLFSKTSANFGQLEPFAFESLPLAAGTTLDFADAATSSPYNDNVGLNLTISLLK